MQWQQNNKSLLCCHNIINNYATGRASFFKNLPDYNKYIITYNDMTLQVSDSKQNSVQTNVLIANSKQDSNTLYKTRVCILPEKTHVKGANSAFYFLHDKNIA